MTNMFIVDVEADGPCPGLYSMLSVGIVQYGEGKTPEFYAQFRPITESFVPSALEVLKVTREETMKYPMAAQGMFEMEQWLHKTCPYGRPVFVSDNPAFDFQFVNFYCHAFLNKNPFGWSGRRIGDYAAGLEGNFFAKQNWKRLRRTKHTHHPVDDARGNCEALWALLHPYAKS